MVATPNRRMRFSCIPLRKQTKADSSYKFPSFPFLAWCSQRHTRRPAFFLAAKKGTWRPHLPISPPKLFSHFQARLFITAPAKRAHRSRLRRGKCNVFFPLFLRAKSEAQSVGNNFGPLYRVTMELHFVGIKVGCYTYPTGRLGKYSDGPMAGRTVLVCVDKG